MTLEELVKKVNGKKIRMRSSSLLLASGIALSMSLSNWGCSSDSKAVGCVDNDNDGFYTYSSDCEGTDCDDNNPNIYLNANELCDGLDNNCDGNVDETCQNSSSGNIAQQICSEAYLCTNTIKETDDGSFYSPVDLSKADGDSEGKMISSNTIIVKFNTSNKQDIKNLLSSFNAKINGYFSSTSYSVLEFPFDSASKVEETISLLAANGTVETAEKNYAVYLDELDVENLDYSDKFAFENIKLKEAYDLIESKSIGLKETNIAILDSGFDSKHEDLHFWGGLDFGDADNDFSNKDMDQKSLMWSHGTEVSGIIAARNNGNGGNGVSFNSQLVPFKVFSSYGDYKYGCFTATVEMALQIAIQQEVDVVNMSFRCAHASSLHQMIKQAYSVGITLIASAGNGDEENDCIGDSKNWPLHCSIGDDASNHYPSAYPEVISVGAVDENDKKAEFSNYSIDNNQDVLTVFAPGVNVYTTSPGNAYGPSCTGTSCAAPLTTGLVALLRSIDKDLSPSEIRQTIISTADNTAAGKRINVFEAVKSVLGDSEPACVEECEYFGQKQCTLSGWRECGDYDEDECFELGPDNACSSIEQCIEGKCVFKGCSSSEWQCPEGTCVSMSSVCDGYNNCSGGEDEDYILCGGTCTDECSEYTAKKVCSSDELWETCTNYDSDPCLEWDFGVCDSDEICKSGECVPKGSDCSPNKNYKDCYNGDVWWFDGCSEPYTKYEDCSTNETCESATCIPTEPVDDNVHLYGKVQTDGGSLAKVKVGVMCEELMEDPLEMIKSVKVNSTSGDYNLTLNVSEWGSCSGLGKGTVMAWNDANSNGGRDSMEEYQVGPMINYLSWNDTWSFQLCDKLDGLSCSADFDCLKTYNSQCF